MQLLVDSCVLQVVDWPGVRGERADFSIRVLFRPRGRCIQSVLTVSEPILFRYGGRPSYIRRTGL